jgi:hypothetical protein
MNLDIGSISIDCAIIDDKQRVVWKLPTGDIGG